jgi:hypothetical protein
LTPVDQNIKFSENLNFILFEKMIINKIQNFIGKFQNSNF